MTSKLDEIYAALDKATLAKRLAPAKASGPKAWDGDLSGLDVATAAERWLSGGEVPRALPKARRRGPWRRVRVLFADESEVVTGSFCQHDRDLMEATVRYAQTQRMREEFEARDAKRRQQYRDSDGWRYDLDRKDEYSRLMRALEAGAQHDAYRWAPDGMHHTRACAIPDVVSAEVVEVPVTRREREPLEVDDATTRDHAAWLEEQQKPNRYAA